MRISDRYTVFFIVAIMPLLSCGQTTIGIKGGLNWGSVRNSKGLSYYEGTYTCDPSYCFGFDVKHRLKNLLRLGGSVEYYMNNTQWYINYGGHNMVNGKDIRYKIGYLRLTIFPEVIKGKKVQFYFNAGPFLNLMVYSDRDGIIWDHGHPPYYVDETVTGSAKEDIKTIDAGLKVCIGFGYKVGQNLVISIESNGSLGLVNISKLEQVDAKTKGISLLAGIVYVFPMNKKVK